MPDPLRPARGVGIGAALSLLVWVGFVWLALG